MKTKKKNSAKKKLDKVEEYYSGLALMSWWEQWNGDCLENGCLKYKTIWQFITAKTKIDWQRKFLYWILGPLGKSEEYKKYQQFDWLSRREKGHWFEGETGKQLQAKVKQQANALDAMKEVGKVNLTFISRIEALATEIDREYSGRLFLSSLSAKENSLRATTYTQLLDKLQAMLGEAQTMFGKTQGMDLQNLQSFFGLFAAGMSSAAANMGFAGSNTLDGDNPNSANSTMTMITQMLLKKTAERDVELPDKDIEGIIVQQSKPQLVRK